ncbi:Ribosome assembly protein rrb1 [Exophiala xenobiotica]|nr:Ribosome assembly protein rrb1 [Exophiala xenobiotica]KAK5385822.1 Ribosome assembly protein rrb1 [Exophiala xenobiotica]KAK5394161.1 Ribosome assembly protein rrb1 [Exophiala xenobiotica]KAK5463241.1 Ribosome assembly protein rrb1 [Exophiala xenobiotica]KAK5496121.1 Ribosome assembly protein rrb1 [Exophiala xenobiotica]
MSKRTADDQGDLDALKAGQRPDAGANGEATLDFEDEFEDEFESEDEIMEAGVDGRPDAEREAEQAQDAMDLDTEDQTFIPGRSILQPGMTLSPDPSTYEMLHTMSTAWPCLSFDIVRDNLGDQRKQYPRTVYAVAGTQAESSRAKENELYILRLSSLSKMDRGNTSDSDSDDDDDDEGSSDPILESRSIPLPSTTNRIRSFQPADASNDVTQIPQTLTATSLENGQVLIHDVSPYLQSLSTPGSTIPPTASKPLSTLRMHKTEGYALDWAPRSLHPNGRLLTGDNAGQIFSTQRTDGGGWVTDSRPFVGHTDAVEELQWSPNEKFVFASASSDGTVKVWDARSKSRKPAVDVKISNTDVNVMSWSQQTFHLLATGADDGQWAVWDLRQWKPQSAGSSQIKPSPVADFNFHKQPITSIEWHPTDDSVVAVACADNTATLWDLAVELDDEEYGKEAGLGLGEGAEKVPPQLLFIHHVEDGKELHWHPQMPGTVMVTGGSGLGVFKTISV